MSEIGDVIDLLEAFEKHNGCQIQLRLTVEKTTKGPDLRVTAAAWEAGIDRSAAKLWALVSVKCSATNLRTLRDAAIHVMYALDLKLVLREFDEKTKAE
jgi:hypothetical protein